MTKSIVLKSFGLRNSSFNTNANAFLSEGYKSDAGNTYFKALWIGNGIALVADIGEGFKYFFLNGVQVYTLNDRKMIAEDTFDNLVFSGDALKIHSANLISNKLVQANKYHNNHIDTESVKVRVGEIVKDTIYGNQEQSLNRLLA